MRRSPRNTPPVQRGVVMDGEVPSGSGVVQNAVPQQNKDPNRSGKNTNNVPPQNEATTPARSSASPVFFNVTEEMFRNLLGGLAVRERPKTSTFSTCSSRFSGDRNSSKVEDFIATILVYKESESIADVHALNSLPLLLEGYASTWWQGVKDEARTFQDAIDLLKKAFAPPKPDWRLYSEIFREKQRNFESTDAFVCRKRSLFAQLSEKLPEKIMIDMIFAQLSMQIRERISRINVSSFQELLAKAREVEMLLSESSQVRKDRKFDDEDPYKKQVKCSYCRKKNHTVENCYKKIEADKHGNVKPPETKLNCYGCGASGYYRSNCPFCNKEKPGTSTSKLDFNSLSANVAGRNVPVVEVNINALDGEAYFDTAARTSVAGHILFEKLKEKGLPFKKVCAQIVLADGIVRNEVVYSTTASIIIGKRFKQINFICLPKAKGNRTLLGIDFLEECGIVLDLAQRAWYFKDEPSKFFLFKMQEAAPINNIMVEDSEKKYRDDVKEFFRNFESSNSKNNDYSPGYTNKLFADCLSLEVNSEKSSDIFPPLKRQTMEDYWKEIFEPIELNAIEFRLRSNEAILLNESEKESIENLLKEESQIFEDIDVPIAQVEHYINTGSHTPISTAPYRISPKMKILLKQELEEMLRKNIIAEMESPWAFPVVLIPKKDNKIRLCVDYRRLNAITTTDTYPLPRMDDLLQTAKTTPFMSTLDLRSGYWQIKIAERDKIKTAFTTPFGIYVFNRMPFGLKNAPATFQRLIDKFRTGLPNITILAYLDDIIICSSSLQCHIMDLRQTFQRLKAFGFHLNREKCHFCLPKVKYLGHILTTEGLKVDPEKTQAIRNRPKPKNPKQVISFLQTCSWYRRFIPGFADVSKPLSDLTKKNAKWMWTEKEQKAFEKLKALLVSPPILKQIDEAKPFKIMTDASNYALGAVLIQGEKEDEHPIEYASRLLLPAERNYSTTEREALAVVWAIQKFRGYIEGSEVQILTDHQPLKWLFSLKSPTGRLARWALHLQMYNINFEYTPGRKNAVADTLSRPPCPKESHDENNCEICSISIDFPRKGADEIRKAQLEDEEIKDIIESFETDNENVIRYINRGFIMQDGVLFRFCHEEDSENGQLVVPKSMRNIILYNHHDEPTAGHYGIERTISRITPHYYWPKMRSEIHQYVKSCLECRRYKATNMKPYGLLQTVSSNQRFEIVAVDLFGPLPVTKRGNQWILIVEDLCSRWTELFALREASAENCAIMLLNEVFLRYGIPRRIHSDNGSQFISAVMQKLTYCLKIAQTFTPVYHPEANPVERKNRDLKVQLSIYVGQHHTLWDTNLPAIRFAMNTAKCATTNYTPAYLTFGRELRTPIEIQHDLRAIVNSENFIPQITPHLLRLADTFERAKENEETMQDKNKTYLDAKRNPQKKIDVGDRVLVSTHVLSNKNKGLAAKFVPRRDGPYVVIDKKGSSTYTVASVDNPTVPLATYHASDIFLYDGRNEVPVYPLRQRGRPRKHNTIDTNNNQNTANPLNIAKPRPEEANLEPKAVSPEAKDESANTTEVPLRRSLRKRNQQPDT